MLLAKLDTGTAAPFFAVYCSGNLTLPISSTPPSQTEYSSPKVYGVFRIRRQTWEALEDGLVLA